MNEVAIKAKLVSALAELLEAQVSFTDREPSQQARTTLTRLESAVAELSAAVKSFRE